MKRLAGMGAYRLSAYLELNRADEIIKKYPGFLCTGVTPDELKDYENDYIESLYEDENSIKRLANLLNPCDAEGKIAWICLELALLYYMDKRVGEVFDYICPGTANGVNLSLVSRIVYGDVNFFDKFHIIRKAYERVELLFLAKYPAGDIFETPLKVDDRLAGWLLDKDDAELLQGRFVTQYIPSEINSAEIIYKDKFEFLSRNVSKCIQNNEHAIITVSGEAQSGRRYLVRRVADNCGFNVVFVDAVYLGNLNIILDKWRKILREHMLNRTIICVSGFAVDNETISCIRILTEEYMAVSEIYGVLPLFLIVDSKIKTAPYLKVPVINCELDTLQSSQAKRIWDLFINRYIGENRFNTDELAVKMKLPIGKIKRIVKRIACEHSNDIIDSHRIFKLCYEILDDGRYDSIKRVESIYTLDDLKLEESQKSIIKDICNQVEFRQKVMEEWNLRSKYQYGTCVSALFSGPPGTGKTMAVHVIAGILGLELFKVDLSQIVDKYIGETEKRLEEVFNKAEQSNMILFFDEADSIIGKRSEVKDSKDKYANTEVSYLLQRIEEYDGIVILATNYSQNIDSAIMRRIRYTVHFPLPDEATRKEIWKSVLPDAVPRAGIDYDYLARQFEFSGGQIKNIMLNAVFFAASQNESVSMRHIVKSIQQELTKDKKVSFNEALGEYAHIVF